MKRFGYMISLVVLATALSGCGSAPQVSQSQAIVWQQFGRKPADILLLRWGPPMAEVKGPDGSRVMSYTYTNMYDIGTKDQRAYTCNVTVTAQPPRFLITDVSMQGPDYECAVIANGFTGQAGFGVSHPSPFFRAHPPIAPF